MNSVAIVGVGLIGGSFALALRKAGFEGKILGVSSARTIEAARARGVIDEALPLEEAVPQADIVYLAQPIERILQTLDAVDPLLTTGSLVTDAGSTKSAIVEKARVIRRGQFLGGHPMAGKERRGVEVADADLFVGRTYVLTPNTPAEMETPVAKNFLEWVRRIGAVPVVLPPGVHDRVVAYTSHLPQLVSTALAATLAGRTDVGDNRQVAGPGLEDMTRLALSTYDIWGDILKTNPKEIQEAMDVYIGKLQELRKKVGDDRMQQEFERAGDFARRLRK